MRDNAKRRAERARRKQLFEHLRLQADILCDSYKSEAKASRILSRMLLVILEIVGARSLNNAKREALADHFTDSSVSSDYVVELGGEDNRDTLYLDGTFSVSDLAKRLTWGEARGKPTVEVDNANS